MTDRELDAWLAVRFGGEACDTCDGWMYLYPDKDCHPLPAFSSTGDGMLLVLEAMNERDFGYEVASDGCAEFWNTVGETEVVGRATNTSLPLAVALAAKAALESSQPAACPDCGCPEDDHRFGAAYQRLVAEDNGARRDGPNPCLNCLNCGRSGE